MAETRAARLKEDLLALMALGEDRASLILAGLPPRDLRRIERSAPEEWLPVEIMVALCRAVHAAVGDDGVRAWRRAARRNAFEGSLFRPLLDASIRMLGVTPRALLRLVPLVWGASFREAGTVAVELATAGTASVRLCDLPWAMRERAVLLSLAGGLEAILAAVGCTGEVRLEQPAEGDVLLLASWKPG